MEKTMRYTILMLRLQQDRLRFYAAVVSSVDDEKSVGGGLAGKRGYDYDDLHRYLRYLDKHIRYLSSELHTYY